MHLQTTYYCFVILSVNYVSSRGERRNHEQQSSDGRVSYEGAQVWRTILNNSRNVLEIKRLIDDNGHRLDFNFYPDFDVIEEYLNHIKNKYRSICTVKTLEYTAENRSIKMVVISNQNPSNQAVLVVSGAHAREWVAVTSALYILNDLVSKFDSHPAYITDKDWYIVPVQNPDGYDYSHKKDRLWRKNRRHIDGACYGVDVNRNYGANWFVKGVTSKDPCSHIYAGSAAFSEPETRAIKMATDMRAMSAFVDIHSYGQLIMYGWGALSTPSAHDKLLNSIAMEMEEAIFETNERTYRVGSIYNTVYPASGSSVDFAHSSGIQRAFAVETRDTGQHGFLLPTDQIIDTGTELTAGVYRLARTLPTYKASIREAK